jgi:hypothetical protein
MLILAGYLDHLNCRNGPGFSYHWRGIGEDHICKLQEARVARALRFSIAFMVPTAMANGCQPDPHAGIFCFGCHAAIEAFSQPEFLLKIEHTSILSGQGVGW